MPELPDVEIYRKEAEKCKGLKINDMEISDSGFVGFSGSDADKKIKGRKIKNAGRIGKHLFMPLEDNNVVVMHFGMTGFLQYNGKNEKSPDYTKCSFILSNGNKLHYSSRRKLGHIDIIDNIDEYLQDKQIGPDALEVGEDDFIEKLKKKKGMIKGSITDQSLFSGIGNVYSDEILFQAKIHPKQRTDKLSDPDIKKLYRSTQKVLKKAIEKNADISQFPDSYLLSGREEGNKCPRCKGKIEKIKVSGRGTYFCPSCQKKEN